jgi:hypothetical protein
MKHLICAALIGLTVSSAAVPALAAKGGHRVHTVKTGHGVPTAKTSYGVHFGGASGPYSGLKYVGRQ